MNTIVSVTSDWAIGNKGQLIVRNREDMRRFKDLTMGGTVIMGRTTFESFPNGPLVGRRNIVVTRSASYAHEHPGIECAASPQEALELVTGEEPDRVWLIGGESLYRELLDECQLAYVTKNDTTVEADAYFPNLDSDDGWCVEERCGSGVTAVGVPFEFLVYRNMRLGR